VVVTGGTVFISWMRPIIEEPLEYILEAGSSPGASNLGIIRASRGQTAMSFANIPSGRYYARIRGVFGSGPRDASDEQVINVGACDSMPPAPSTFTSRVAGNIVTLTWSMPASAAEPSAFVIEAGSASGFANLAVLNLPGGMRSLTVGAPAGRYYVRMKGRNACGDGAVSSEVTIDVR
jgi:hypothetical protein